MNPGASSLDGVGRTLASQAFRPAASAQYDEIMDTQLRCRKARKNSERGPLIESTEKSRQRERESLRNYDPNASDDLDDQATMPLTADVTFIHGS